MELYFTRLHWNTHTFPVSATADGLCYVGAWDEPEELFDDWSRKHLPRAERIASDTALAPYTEQLLAYLNQQSTTLSFPIAPVGTPFQLEVWHALRAVPYGQTATYSDIAERLFRPNATRAIGTAIGKNRLLLAIPCHRIIGKKGDLLGYHGGLNMKRTLLALEQRL